jgi:hypothetical protein
LARRPPTDIDVSRASAADLLPAARQLLELTSGPGALGKAVPGDRVLLVVPVDQDPRVVEAVISAFKEREIVADAVDEHVVGMTAPLEGMLKHSVADGWREILTKEDVARLLHPSLMAERGGNILDGKRDALRSFLSRNEPYTAVFAGRGGQTQMVGQLGEHGGKFRETWMYVDVEDLLSGHRAFPSELARLIERKILDLLPSIRTVRVSDPEGTRMEFSVGAAEAQLWAEGADTPGMLVTYPLSASRTRVQKGLVPAEEEILVFPKANGIIAGTANHEGYYPRILCRVEDGVVTDVEGGGRFGELLRELLWKTREVQYPRHPKPGYFYVNEMSLGTNPKVVRKRLGVFDTYRHYPNARQRHRAGALKWGIGVHAHHPAIKAFNAETHMPIEHAWHVYNFFPTWEAQLQSGEWVALIERGHLVALDDPEVRERAGAFGDADQVLSEAWFPAIPGINHPGDYWLEYGRDPASWVRRENEDRLPDVLGLPELR